MPPYLSFPYFHLSKLPLTTKLVLTGFSLAITAGLVFTGVVYFPKLLEPEREQARNVLGREVGSVEAWRQHMAPQEVEREYMKKLEASREETEEAVRKAREGQTRKAYDIVHPHAFLMPVVYFILCHLMEMTTIRRWVKIGLYTAGFAGMILTIFAPLIVLGMPWAAAPTFIGLYVMLGSFAVMALAPVGNMWFGGPRKGARVSG